MEANLTILQNHSYSNANVKVGLVVLVPEWCRRVLTAFLTFFFLTGLPGNIVVIIVQAKIKRKSSTDWFVIFLAICDIMSLVVCVPVFITIAKEWWPKIGSSSGCKFHHFLLHFTLSFSTVLIAIIGLDRLWQTKSAGWDFTTNKVFIGVSGAFGVSTVLGIISAFCTKNNILGHCIYDPDAKKLQLVLYLMFISIVTVSSIIIFYCYFRIFIILKSRMKTFPASETSEVTVVNSNSTSSSVTRNHYGEAVRTTKLMFVVTVVFVISAIIPVISVIGLTSTDYRNNEVGRIVMFFLCRMCVINNCTNPYFYIWLNSTFRKRTVAVFTNVCLLCK